MPISIPNVNVSIEAEVKQGKSTFVYTGPLPIVGFQWDQGIEGGLFGEYAMSTKLFDACDVEILAYRPDQLGAYKAKIDTVPANGILVVNLPSRLQINPEQLEGCAEEWRYAQELLLKAQRTAQVRSIVVDTMTGARECAVDAHLEGLQREKNAQIELQRLGGMPVEKRSAPRLQLIQVEYNKPNGFIKDIWSSTKGDGKNLLGSHHLTDGHKTTVRADGAVVQELSGERVLSGYGRTYEQVDVALRFARERRRDLMGKYTDMVVARFIWCRWNLSLEGEELINPTWNKLMQFIMDRSGGRLSLPLREVDGAVF